MVMNQDPGNSEGRGTPANPRSDSDQVLMLYRIRRSTGWMAFFSAVIAIGGAASAYFFWQQLDVMQDQLEQMQELSRIVQRSLDAGSAQSLSAAKVMPDLADQIRRSIESSNRQAGAAERLGDIANKALLSLDRPWVGIESVAIGLLQSNHSLALKVVVHNGGRSPAFNLQAIFNATIPAAKDVVPPEIRECSGCFLAPLLPNASTNYDVVVDASVMTTEKIKHIKSGVDVIVLFGKIYYTDASKELHTTSVCMTYAPNLAEFGACAEGNFLD
jgi:hypothetical protein